MSSVGQGSNFTSIPILNYTLLSSSETRPVFIKQLRNALINVIAFLPKFFGLPQERKDALRMANSPHFLGYSRLGVEMTKGAVDQREQLDFATPLENTWKLGEPEYLRLWGPSQWPAEEDLPGFKAAFLRYLKAVESLSYEFVGLLAESLGLPPDGLAQFFDARERMQHRAKIVKYPTRDTVASGQGVGPHFDAGFLTFLLQASDHPGLQVQNLSGEWIDVPPRPYTFVVNIGKALESVTQGLARATSHRVLAPAAGTSPRYSIPFFQNIAQNLRLSEHVLQFPAEVLELKGVRGQLGQTDSVNFTEYESLPSGEVTLINRVKALPRSVQTIFPYGLPVHGTAY
ncbi:Clavaminate synthase-like protein [Multifurca ochricompacta]|uniref:Clavaminate synthase-like protein n=1 Tax=Multifurca ochricompacta TaxID=376703 RepID=A0AAD4MAA0_9AGAM|nr:Clavaminate synthase-like protein [Multifurca ochricompacta]